MSPVFDYLRPELPAGLPRVVMPIVDASAAALRGYGALIDDPRDCTIEIVRWPAAGKRPVDEDTGDQDGTTEGIFVAQWQGDILFGRNEAVLGDYIHPNIWHEGVFSVRGTQRFFDKQGAVHARVSVDFAREFGCLIEAAVR